MYEKQKRWNPPSICANKLAGVEHVAVVGWCLIDTGSIWCVMCEFGLHVKVFFVMCELCLLGMIVQKVAIVQKHGDAIPTKLQVSLALSMQLRPFCHILSYSVPFHAILPHSWCTLLFHDVSARLVQFARFAPFAPFCGDLGQLAQKYKNYCTLGGLGW